MYPLLKMVIFHCHVSFLRGNWWTKSPCFHLGGQDIFLRPGKSEWRGEVFHHMFFAHILIRVFCIFVYLHQNIFIIYAYWFLLCSNYHFYDSADIFLLHAVYTCQYMFADMNYVHLLMSHVWAFMPVSLLYSSYVYIQAGFYTNYELMMLLDGWTSPEANWVGDLPGFVFPRPVWGARPCIVIHEISWNMNCNICLRKELAHVFWVSV